MITAAKMEFVKMDLVNVIQVLMDTIAFAQMLNAMIRESVQLIKMVMHYAPVMKTMVEPLAKVKKVWLLYF